MEVEAEIGEYRLLPKGESLWAIGIQHNVTFDKDVIIELTNTTGSSSYFGKMKILLFNLPGQIPTLIDNIHGDVMVEINKTIPYSIPAETFIKYDTK